MPYVGQITMFACNFNPLTWLTCDGKTLPRQGYLPLYSVIGQTFGGTGSVFQVPNLGGVAPMHWGTGPGLSPRNIADEGGSAQVILGPDQLAVHTHSPAATIKSTATTPAGNVWSTEGETRPAPDLYANTLTNPQAMAPGIIGSTGGTPNGTQPHNNLMPFQVLNFCIATASD